MYFNVISILIYFQYGFGPKYIFLPKNHCVKLHSIVTVLQLKASGSSTDLGHSLTEGGTYPQLPTQPKKFVHCTEVHFASFLSGGFTTMV